MRRSAWDWKPDEHEMAAKVRVCPSTKRPVDVAYRVVGTSASAPAVLLLCGLNSNMEMFHPDFIDALAAAGPFRVVCVDNRDTGHSSHFDGCAASAVPTFFLPRSLGMVTAPYSLGDMADDAAALLDKLGIARAVIMGGSMGGMLAQVFALRHPAKTAALVSFNSTTHGPRLPDPSLRTKMGFLRTPRDNSDAALAELKKQWCLDFGIDPANRPRPEFADYFKTTGERMVARSRYDGFQRQMAAIITAPPRDEQLRHVACPALVIVGARDVVVLPPHGYRTAACLPRARLLVLPTSGHCTDPGNHAEIVEAVAAVHRLACSDSSG